MLNMNVQSMSHFVTLTRCAIIRDNLLMENAIVILDSEEKSVKMFYELFINL